MTFAAARANNVKQVEKGVYEDNVDAAGGEVKKGCEEFVIPLPTDPKETLTHIAVKHGNTHLVKWLDLHCKLICAFGVYRLLVILLQVPNRTNATHRV